MVIIDRKMNTGSMPLKIPNAAPVLWIRVMRSMSFKTGRLSFNCNLADIKNLETWSRMINALTITIDRSVTYFFSSSRCLHLRHNFA